MSPAPDCEHLNRQMAAELSPSQVKSLLARNAGVQFIDVREPHERAARAIPGTLHIPLGHLPRRLHALDPERPVVVHCKSGMRSAMACQLLRRMGFREVYNLCGGIDAWD